MKRFLTIYTIIYFLLQVLVFYYLVNYDYSAVYYIGIGFLSVMPILVPIRYFLLIMLFVMSMFVVTITTYKTKVLSEKIINYESYGYADNYLITNIDNNITRQVYDLNKIDNELHDKCRPVTKIVTYSRSNLLSTKESTKTETIFTCK